MVQQNEAIQSVLKGAKAAEVSAKNELKIAVDEFVDLHDGSSEKVKNSAWDKLGNAYHNLSAARLNAYHARTREWEL